VPSRLRRAAILFLGGLVVIGLAVLAVLDPFHLRHARWFTVGAITLAVLLLTAAFAVLVGRGVLRVFVLVLGAVALGGWATLAWLAVQLNVDSTAVDEVDDGGRRLVVLESVPIIDRAYAVVVRSGSGPFEQESVVYQGLESARPPSAIRFVDADTVEVATGQGCVYRSDIEPVTLEVRPVHRPARLDSC
jgi:hypothetical protein